MHRFFSHDLPGDLPEWVYRLHDRVVTLERKMEYLMSDESTLQGKVAALNDTLTAIASDWAGKVSEISDLEQKLQALQNTTPPSVDLSGVLAQATAIRESMEASAPSAPVASADATSAAGGDTAGASGGDTTGAAGGDATGGDATGAAGGDPAAQATAAAV